MDEARLASLQEDRIHLVRTLDDLANAAERESRVFTDQEQNQVSSLKADLTKTDNEIKKIEHHMLELDNIRATVDSMRGVDPATRKTDPGATSGEPKPSNQTPVIPIHRYGPLKAFTGPDAMLNAYTSGMWLIATLIGQKDPNHAMVYKAKTWCQQNGVFSKIQAAMGTGTPSGGGNLVPDVMSQTIIDLRDKYGIFRQWTRVVPMTSDTLIIPRISGHVSAYFTAENTAITESAMTVNQVQLTAKKLASLIPFSTELNDDAIVSMADLLTNDIAWAFAKREDEVGFNGTGIATDGNIIGVTTKLADGAHTAGMIDIAGVTHNLFSEVDNVDITSFIGALPQYALGPNTAFFTSQLGASVMFGRLMATAGGNTQETLQRFGITAMGQKGIVGSYLGYPIVASQVLPAGAATDYNNAIMMLFGDLSMATTMGERRQITFTISNERGFIEDQIWIKATSRIDIVAHDLGSTTAAGPIIGLVGSSS